MKKILLHVMLSNRDSSINNFRMIEARVNHIKNFECEVICYAPIELKTTQSFAKTSVANYEQLFSIKSKTIFGKIVKKINAQILDFSPSYDVIINLTDRNQSLFLSFISSINDVLFEKICKNTNCSTISLVEERISRDFFTQFDSLTFACTPNVLRLFYSAFKLVKTEEDVKCFHLPTLFGFVTNRANLGLVKVEM